MECRSCWSRFISGELYDYHRDECSVIAERNNNKHKIKNPAFCLNTSPLFNVTDIHKSCGSDEDDESSPTLSSLTSDCQVPVESYQLAIVPIPQIPTEVSVPFKVPVESNQVAIVPNPQIPTEVSAPLIELALIPLSRRLVEQPEMKPVNASPPESCGSQVAMIPEANNWHRKRSHESLNESKYVYDNKYPQLDDDGFYAHKCDQCGKYADDIKEHMKRHPGKFRNKLLEKEKRLREKFRKSGKKKCPKCKIKFHDKLEVKFHIRAVHECVICPKCDELIETDHGSSNASVVLKEHQHMEEKFMMYFKFDGANELNANYHKYFDEMTNVCKVCTKPIKGLKKKKDHFFRHVGARYKCPLCHRSFANDIGVRRHASMSHGEELDPANLRLHWLMIDGEAKKKSKKLV